MHELLLYVVNVWGWYPLGVAIIYIENLHTGVRDTNMRMIITRLDGCLKAKRSEACQSKLHTARQNDGLLFVQLLIRSEGNSILGRGRYWTESGGWEGGGNTATSHTSVIWRGGGFLFAHRTLGVWGVDHRDTFEKWIEKRGLCFAQADMSEGFQKMSENSHLCVTHVAFLG